MTTFGRYTLVRKLAVGGMAEVFLARADGPMGFQKRCVVKRILPHFSDDPSFVQMFLGEARLAAELNHPNLVQVFDFGEVEGQYFIAMEFIDGPNLRVLNREVRQRRGPLKLPLAARIISLAAEGLHFAHELTDETGALVNLVHRDISPDNILVSRTGSVKVVDFGIAKAANQPHLTKSGTVKGKLAYMPPEQLAREPLDRRSDLFSLGVVLFELVTGEMPFDATSEVSIIQAILGQEPLRRLRSRRTDAPPMLDDIIARCLAKSPHDRYPSCRELQHDLEQFLQQSGAPVGASDIAATVQEFLSHEPDLGGPSKVSTGGALLAPTVPRSMGPAPTRGQEPDQPPPEPASGPGNASPPAAARRPPSRRVDPSAAETVRNGPVAPAPPRKPPFALIGGLLVLGLAAGVVAYVLMGQGVSGRGGPARPSIEVLSAHDAGPAATAALSPATLSPVPTIEVEVVDAGTALAVVAGPTVGAPPVDSGAPPRPPVVAHRTGRLELRIRPYATVSIDGREVGDTPLPVQTLPVGRHKVRLVNPGLEKDVVLEVVVKPGDNLLKHNFKE
jgi:serine/threonine-protein kinase